MANYNSIKNAALIAPTTNPDLGSATNRYGNVYLSGNVNIAGTSLTSTNALAPKVTSIVYPNDDTAADTAGGQTIILNGSGFVSGATILISGTAAGTVAFVSSSVLTFTSPAMSAGGYVMYVINPDGGTAIAVPGIQYSGTPMWSTGAGALSTVFIGASINITLAATGDAPITYSLYSGTLPSGITLNSSTGVLSGTAPAVSSSTTYTFTIRATDLQKQDTNRSFSITINSVLLFSTPAILNGSASTFSVYAITCNSSGLFVAVGYNQSGVALYTTSSNGSTWSTPGSMAGGYFMVITAAALSSGGKYVAVGGGSSSQPLFSTSTNGTTWSVPAMINGSSTAFRMTSIAVNSSGKFVVVGTSGGSNWPTVATSTDGSTWTTPTQTSATAVYELNSIAVNSSGKFVAVGGQTGTAYAMYMTSTDGSTWTTPAAMNNDTNTVTMTGVTVNSSGLFVAVGYGFSTKYPYFATSTDGSTWTTPALINGSSTFAKMTAISVSSSGLFVAIGQDTNNYPVYTTSINGTTWNTPALMNGVSAYAKMYALTCNSSGLFVAAGENASYYPLSAISS